MGVVGCRGYCVNIAGKNQNQNKIICSFSNFFYLCTEKLKKHFNMRKILTLTVVILAVSFTSCSKDKDNNTNPLIGEWALQSSVKNGIDTKGICGEFTYVVFTEKEIEFHTFKEETGCSEEIRKVSYTMSNNKITFDINGSKSIFSYVVNGDILTMTSENSGIVITYKKNARKMPPPVVVPGPTNPFVGTWVLESFIANGIDETTDCERKERVIFTNSTITINGSYVHPNNSCQTNLDEFTYTYTNGKISVKEKKNGDVFDSLITFALENGMLVITEVDDNSKTVSKYKKQ